MKKLTCNLFNVPKMSDAAINLVACIDPDTNKPVGGNKGILLRYSIWRENFLRGHFENDPAVEDAVAEVWGNYHMRKSNRRLKFSVVEVDA